MSKVTLVIPARNELYLNQTVDDIFAKARGDIEVILVLDDCWNLPLPADRPNLTIVHWGGRRGLRAAVNCAAEIGHGEFLLKVDAHVAFCEGFDEILKADCDVDWVVTPRRYSLDVEAWGPKTDKPPVDHEYLTYPYDPNGVEVGLHGKYWWRDRDRAHPEDISENLGWQGSCWMMPMRYFRELVYPMDDLNYGMFIGEPGEIGFKIWLSGGKNMLNKKCSYSHLWKGKGYRELHMQRLGFPYTRVGMSELVRGNKYLTDYWMNDRWEKRIHNFAWLIDRFMPIPGWEKWLEDQREKGNVK